MTAYYVWPPHGGAYHEDYSAQGYGAAECGANYFHRAGFGGQLYLEGGWHRGKRPPPNRRLCLRCKALRAKGEDDGD